MYASPVALTSVDLGARLKAARERAGMTQRDLAYALGQADPRLAKTDTSQLSGWENGLVPRIPFYSVVAIAVATGTPISVFLEVVPQQVATATNGTLEAWLRENGGDAQGGVADAAAEAQRLREVRAARRSRRPQRPT